MKNLFKYIFSFLMILILLVSSLQFSLYKMECLMSGNVQVSLSSFDDCNKTTTNGNTISQKCCDFDDITLDFDFDTNELKEIKTLTSTLLSFKLNTFLFKSIVTITDFNFYTNLTPPSGSELLKLVQTFII